MKGLVAACLLLVPVIAIAQSSTAAECAKPKHSTGPVYGKIGLLAAIAQSVSDNDDERKCQKAKEAQLTAESLAVVRKVDAQWNLFLPKARMVMQQAVDSLGLRDS